MGHIHLKLIDSRAFVRILTCWIKKVAYPSNSPAKSSSRAFESRSEIAFLLFRRYFWRSDLTWSCGRSDGGSTERDEMPLLRRRQKHTRSIVFLWGRPVKWYENICNRWRKIHLPKNRISRWGVGVTYCQEPSLTWINVRFISPEHVWMSNLPCDLEFQRSAFQKHHLPLDISLLGGCCPSSTFATTNPLVDREDGFDPSGTSIHRRCIMWAQWWWIILSTCSGSVSCITSTFSTHFASLRFLYLSLLYSVFNE